MSVNASCLIIVKGENIQTIMGIIPPVYPTLDESSDPPIFLDNQQLKIRVTHFQDKLKQFIQRDDWPHLDLSNLASSLFLEDGIHLNESGQIEISRLLEQVISAPENNTL